MNNETVQQVFQNILSGNQHLIEQGTKFLEDNQLSPNFMPQMMEIADSGANQLSIRQFALTQLKSAAERIWKAKNYPEGDKIKVKDNILTAITRIADVPELLKIYESILHKIIQNDYPKSWLNFDQLVLNILSNGTMKQEFLVGLIAVKNVVKIFEFQQLEDKVPLNNLVLNVFPSVYQLLQKIVNLYNQETAVLMTQLLRIFRRLITLEIPSYFDTNREQFIMWIQIVIHIMEREPEDPALLVHPQTEHQTLKMQKQTYWRNKKLANKILFRVIQKFYNPQLNSNWFMAEFQSTYSKKIIELQLRILYLQKTQYIATPVINHSLRYVYFAVRVKDIEEMLWGKLFDILKEVCVPMLRLSNKDIELWQTDPLEVIRKEDDFSSIVQNKQRCAMDLVEQICKRVDASKQMVFLQQLFQYYYAALSTGVVPDTQQPLDNQMLDGILWSFGVLKSLLDSDKLLKQNVEGVLEKFVLPLFQSPHLYLQARACWLYGEYGYLEYKNVAVIQQVTKYLVGAMQSNSEVLSYKAAVALNFVLTKKYTKDIVKNELDGLLKVYLTIIDRIDSESLVTALEGIIANFSKEVTPFAYELCIQLSAQFFKLQEKEEGSDEEGEAELAAAQVFATINRILKSPLDQSMYLKLIPVLLPLINQGINFETEYVDESLETLAILVQRLDVIPDELWFYYSVVIYLLVSLPEQLHIEALPISDEMKNLLEQVKGGWGLDMIDRGLPSLKNFIQKGSNVILTTANFLGESSVQLLFRILDKAAELDSNGEDDTEVVSAFQLFIALIENNFGKIDALIPPILLKTLEIFKNFDSKKSNYFQVTIFGVVSMCFYYNVRLTLAVTEQHACTQNVLTKLVETTAICKGDYECQRILLGIQAILQLQQQELPVSVQAVYHSIIKVLPTFTKKVLDLREESDDEDGGDNDDEDGEKGGDDDSDDSYQQYMYANYDDHYKSPLNQVDEIIELKKVFDHMSAQNPPFFAQIISVLTQEEKQLLENNIIEAQKQYQEFLQAQQTVNNTTNNNNNGGAGGN